MWMESWGSVARVLVSGLFSYVFLVVLLRFSGKRTLSKLNAFDLVVTVAMGSTLSAVVLSADVPLAEGATGFLVLVLCQFVLARGSVRSRRFAGWVRSEPRLLLTAGHVLDGRSLAGFLRGERETTREWIFAYQADRRILRTERWLLEDNSPRQRGRLFDCGSSRNGSGYKDVTDSSAPEVVAAWQHFETLLKDLPAPLLETDGAPNQRNEPKKKERGERKRKG